MKITGSKGYADSLFGGIKADKIYGNGGNDLISAWQDDGDAAKDSVWAGDGDDLISGFSFNFGNVAQSGSRGAFVDGGSGYDMLIIDGQASGSAVDLDKLDIVSNIVKVEEIIYNFSGATLQQRYLGTNAGETIYIGESGSTVDGGKGNDNLFAGSGDDILAGGAGNDFLSAEGGRNTLTGGEGSDYFTFRLTEDYSYSNITDFQKGSDKIALMIDIGQGISTQTFGDGLRFIDRPMDELGYLDYDHGRTIGRSDFAASTGLYNGHVIYEQETGSFIFHYVVDDGNGGDITYDVLLAHLDNKPALDASDFVFMIV